MLVRSQLEDAIVLLWALVFSYRNLAYIILLSFPSITFIAVVCKKLQIAKRLSCKNMDKKRPHSINTALLWEFDLDTFNYVKSAKIVIERVLERGNLEEWRNMVNYYSREIILETIEWSAQLEQRDKEFSRFFLDSGFLHVA